MIYISQIYVEPGCSYPLSCNFQQRLGLLISERVADSERLTSVISPDYSLHFRISAKSALHQPICKGPTVFHDSKDVEYTIFLPYKNLEIEATQEWKKLLITLLDEIIRVMSSVKIDTTQLARDAERIVSELLHNPNTFILRK